MKTNLIVIFVILFCITASAQNKRAMTIEDSKTWNQITQKSISTNGRYVSYKIEPNKGDANLYLYDHQTGITKKFERGDNAKISYDNNFIIFKIEPQADSLRLKKFKKVKKDLLPKDSLGIYFFQKDSLIKVEKLKQFTLPEKNGDWLAYMYDYKAPKDTTKNEEDSLNIDQDTLKSKTDPLKTKKKAFKQKGNRLIILNTKNLNTYTYENISDIIATENGTKFAFLRQIKDSVDTAKVFIFNTKLAKEQLLFEKAGEVQKMAFDKSGEQLVFLHSSDTCKAKKFSLWYALNSKSPTILMDTAFQSLPKNWGVSENRQAYFSDSGKRLYLGVAPFPKAEPKDTLLDDEKVNLDIWSWTDKRLQPEQLNDLKEDLKTNYLGYFELKSKTWIQIEDSALYLKSSHRKTDPQFYVCKSIDAYQKTQSWTPDNYGDFYIVDAKTGTRKLLAQQKIWNGYASPSGNHTLVWDQETELWSAINNTTLKAIVLTKNIDDVFYNANHDTPSLRNSNGIAGWSEDEKSVYINSQFDIWQLDVQGKKAPINITKGQGKKEKIEYRFQTLDRDAVYLPANQWMLHSFNTITKAEGYYWLDINSLQITTLFEENKAFMPPIKAENADKIIWANSTFEQFPNLRISDLNFQNDKVLCDANPQQKEILWGKMNLTQWTDFNGDTLKGLLMLPENFDATKKYPVIIYFYEKYTDNLYAYWTPRPTHSTINFPFYTSNGYIVFVPDINYGTGLPGKDAYNAIVSGTQHISTFPFVNPSKIGIQGQSWGGYQVAYLVTQTNLYACGMAGAPVSNMTSAYGGIRWESGMSRMFQYEHTQSRIGGTLWEKRDKYIENSPIFFADRVETPLLIMHNDGDGAVPWYQGIEYFVALRRLNKPAWLLNYNGDGHNLRKWPNRVDLSIRMFDFFEHYLKDQAMPEWMKKGLPATEKGKSLRY